MKVWLDDERPAPAGWTHVRTADDAIAVLIAEEPFGGVEELSLDHDLGDDAAGTGYDVLSHIEHELAHGYISSHPRLHIHTANPPARKRMEAAVASIERLAGAS